MKRDICGVLIDDLSKKQLLSRISDRLAEKKRTVIFTPNPIMARNAEKDRSFMRVLNSADYNIPDGSGIILASRLLNTPIPERICGIELGESLLHTAAKNSYKVFLFGGKEGVADLAAKRLCEKITGLSVCGTMNGYDHTPKEAVEAIARSGAQILYVCLGSPKQEKWIHENMDKLGEVKLFMALGGSLDVWAGIIPRAPKPIRKIGFEWAWRMTLTPKKLKDLPKLVSFGARTVAKGISDVVTMHK